MRVGNSPFPRSASPDTVTRKFKICVILKSTSSGKTHRIAARGLLSRFLSSNLRESRSTALTVPTNVSSTPSKIGLRSNVFSADLVEGVKTECAVFFEDLSPMDLRPRLFVGEKFFTATKAASRFSALPSSLSALSRSLISGSSPSFDASSATISAASLIFCSSR